MAEKCYTAIIVLETATNVKFKKLFIVETNITVKEK